MSSDPRVARQDVAGAPGDRRSGRRASRPAARPAATMISAITASLTQREQLVLGADVVVQRHRAGVELGGETAHRQGVEALGVGDPQGGLGDLVAGEPGPPGGRLGPRPQVEASRQALRQSSRCWDAPSAASLAAACSAAGLLGAGRRYRRALRSTLSAMASPWSRRRLRRPPDGRPLPFVQCTANVVRTMYDTLVQPTSKPAAVGGRRGRRNEPPLIAGAAHGGVVATGLGKRFGDLWALRDLDLDVAPGTVLGLLGHNGAGKTTAIRILTTLSTPTEGTATVGRPRRRRATRRWSAAHRRRRPAGHRRRAARRPRSTSRWSAGCTTCAPRPAARADELLERFDLADAGDRLVKNFSGGMRRRLDLAASLVATPAGAVPRRADHRARPAQPQRPVGDAARPRRATAPPSILTTQYLEEADRLADDIVVLDHGVTVAHGTPDELKARIGDDRIDVTVTAADELAPAAAALGAGSPPATPTSTASSCASRPRPATSVGVIDVVRALDDERDRRRRHRPSPGHPRRRLPHPHRPVEHRRIDRRHHATRRCAA